MKLIPSIIFLAIYNLNDPHELFMGISTNNNKIVNFAASFVAEFIKRLLKTFTC